MHFLKTLVHSVMILSGIILILIPFKIYYFDHHERVLAEVRKNPNVLEAAIEKGYSYEETLFYVRRIQAKKFPATPLASPEDNAKIEAIYMCEIDGVERVAVVRPHLLRPNGLNRFLTAFISGFENYPQDGFVDCSRTPPRAYIDSLGGLEYLKYPYQK